MKTIAALICLFGLLGTLPAHASESTDVLGRQVPVGQGRPALVLYTNRGTREELRNTAYPFIYGLRSAHPVIVVHVDLRDVPGLFKGLARKELLKSYRASLEAMRKVYREQGEQPPVDLESSFFMVADSQGESHEALGLKKGFDQVLAQAVGPSGQELARGPFPQSAPVIGRALSAGGNPPLTPVAGMLHKP
ncbi:hypothetical protein [Hyalangium versicolor]|uniref:hypothetical protein n=1 Tax=Hyalangium versicolor TaxID=2861190 RepID=UPI001CC94131|nr:hypothetical protein [Hyalangium versicolor]